MKTWEISAAAAAAGSSAAGTREGEHPGAGGGEGTRSVGTGDGKRPPPFLVGAGSSTLTHNAHDSKVIWCRHVYYIILLACPVSADNIIENDVTGHNHLACCRVQEPIPLGVVDVTDEH
jgi:hypothetical protein